MLFASCGKKDTAESVTDELLNKFNAVITAVESATDKESAEAAAEKIDSLSEEIDAIVVRLDALEEPGADEKTALDEKMDKAMEANGEKIGNAMKGLAGKPEAMKIMGEALQEFGKKMNAHEEVFKKFGKEG